MLWSSNFTPRYLSKGSEIMGTWGDFYDDF